MDTREVGVSMYCKECKCEVPYPSHFIKKGRGKKHTLEELTYNTDGEEVYTYLDEDEFLKLLDRLCTNPQYGYVEQCSIVPCFKRYGYRYDSKHTHIVHSARVKLRVYDTSRQRWFKMYHSGKSNGVGLQELVKRIAYHGSFVQHIRKQYTDNEYTQSLTIGAIEATVSKARS